MSSENYDADIVFPRWKEHSRPRSQILLVYLDASGFLIHADKQRLYNPITKHQWNHVVQNSYLLPDRKRAEIFETYRHLQFLTVGGVFIEWSSHQVNPIFHWKLSKEEMLSFFHDKDSSCTFFELQTNPATRKRCAWMLFLQPSRESILNITKRDSKRLFQLKSAVRKNVLLESDLSTNHLTKRNQKNKKRVEIFGVRDPLNADSEKELLRRKKNRKT